MANIWVYAEITGGKVQKVALEMISKARTLGDVTVVALGPGASDQAAILGQHGAKKVFVSDDKVFDEFLAEPHSEVLGTLLEQNKPDLLMVGSTYLGRDIAARINARFECGVITDAAEISMDGGNLKVTVPWFSASIIVDVTNTNPGTKLVLTKPKSFAAEPSGDAAPQVEQISFAAPESSKRARILETVIEKGEGPSLEDAAIIISGGRGLKEAKNFGLLHDLAGTIGGAAVGATRAVVDSGWVPYAMQVGQTGKTVKPTVYIAVGISGAIQHTVGMKSAKNIIAINTDEDAPIFKFADLGVVGNALQIVPALNEEIRKRKG